MQRNLFKIILKVMLLFGLILFGTCVLNVNRIYPRGEVYTYKCGEQFENQDFTIIVENVEFDTKEQVEKNYSDVILDAAELKDTDYMLIADIKVTYNGSAESESFSLEQVSAQSSGFCNSSDYMAMKSANPSVQCKKGEEVELKTMIPIRQSMFPDLWKNSFQNREYLLVFSTYPNVIQVKVNS